MYEYHSAIQIFNLVNEADLILPGLGSPLLWGKAVASAFDAVLDAEKEAKVTGRLPNFTATVSFGVCPACKTGGKVPALGQMETIRVCMRQPDQCGYTPRNDLW